MAHKNPRVTPIDLWSKAKSPPHVAHLCAWGISVVNEVLTEDALIAS